MADILPVMHLKATEKDLNAALTTLRQDLHAHPELSGDEHATHDRIAEFIRVHAPDARLVERVGATGLAAVVNPDLDAPTLIYRADTDALPIPEQTRLPYVSNHAGVMHACGHDGHATIGAGLAAHFSANPPTDKRLVFLFQPAEEIGTGAEAVLKDPRFTALIPDPTTTRAIAIHNLPGFPLGQLVLKPGPMCPASMGLRLILTGVGGHSSQPHLAQSPIPVAAELIRTLTELPKRMELLDALITTTFVGSGLDLNFGITPAEAIVCVTLRAMRDTQLDTMLDRGLDFTRQIAKRAGVQVEHATYERFGATINDRDLAARIHAIALDSSLDALTLDIPMPWSEDFGRFTDAFPGMLMGIGAGLTQPHLHASDYDYPDAMTPLAIDSLRTIIEHL